MRFSVNLCRCNENVLVGWCKKMTKNAHESNNRVTVGKVFPAPESPLIGLCCHQLSLSCTTVQAVNPKKGVDFGARESYQHSYFYSNTENSSNSVPRLLHIISKIIEKSIKKRLQYETFWYLFEALGPPSADLETKGIRSGFQNHLFHDFNGF